MQHKSIKSVDVVKPLVAGRFYPADPGVLQRDVFRYIDEAEINPTKKNVLAVLSPHAGYVFSGPVAGYSFRYVQDQKPDTVLVIALSHQGVDGGCLLLGNYFETPLGRIPIDQELTNRLLDQGAPLFADPAPFQAEHSVEVNLPFVQTVFPDAKVAALLITHTEPDLCRQVGRQVANVIKSCPDKKVLIVVSSDMSHYPSYELAKKIDQEMLSAVESLDPDLIYTKLKELCDNSKNAHCVMCGGGAMLTAVEAALSIGVSGAKTLCYRNSGDCPMGEDHRVVGYGSLAIYAKSDQEDRVEDTSMTAGNEMTLSQEDKRTLLSLARQSIYSTLNKESYEPKVDNPSLKEKCGVFVTLKNAGELRGCLGRFDPGDLTLDHLIPVMAAQSATHDIRFKPVKLDELENLDIQISVLTPLERVNHISEIEVGKHGLQINGRNSSGIMRSGTLLPQVATEQNWDVDAFLNATCVKAGLDAGCLEDPDTEIWKYSAVIFGDLDYGPPPYQI